MRWISPLLVVVLIASLGMVVGCTTPPQSEELQQLEQKLRSDEAQELRQLPNAARYHQEARQYRRVAEEAREERREDRSREYALLGLLRYRTAVAIYEKFQVAEGMDEINNQIAEINPEIRETAQARNELAEELRHLDADIREAVQERQQQRLAQARQHDQGFDPAGDGSGAQDAEVLEEANAKIDEAEQLRDAALEHRADEYPETRGLFSRADTQLESAREMIQENPRTVNTAKRQLGFAVQLFEEAHEQAVPIHEEYVEMMRPDNRIDAIRTEAQNNFSSQFTERERGGIRVIMARLFVAGEDEFGHETEALVDALVDIVDEYEEFNIDIIGHTRRQGGATEARALSQTRAQKVQNYLVDEGIDSGRINHEGVGYDEIRYSDSPDNNDRVEVILRHEER